MDILIFGNSPLEICFEQSPDRGLDLICRGNYVLNVEHMDQDITWKDLIQKTKPSWVAFLAEDSLLADFKKSWGRFKKELVALVGSETERRLLLEYFDICEKSFPDDGQPRGPKETIRQPALIPRAWLNWLNYSPQNKVHSKRVKKEPFQVDFVMVYSGRKMVMEIDRATEWNGIPRKPGREKPDRESLAAEKFTEHLRKNRWLQRKGWEVWRFSETEIKNREFGLWGALQEMECEDLFF